MGRTLSDHEVSEHIRQSLDAPYRDPAPGDGAFLHSHTPEEECGMAHRVSTIQLLLLDDRATRNDYVL